MRNNRICHLTSAHSCHDDRIFLKECRAAAAAGFETHLIAPNAPGEIRDGVHLHGVYACNSSRWWRMTAVVGGVYQLARSLEADLYHFHDPELLPVGLLLKLQGKRVIYDVHEDYSQNIIDKAWLPKLTRSYVAQLTASLEKFVARKLDLAVVVTSHIQDRFLKMGCRTEIIYNYPLLEEFYFPEIDWSRKEKAVCYAGGINEMRGLFDMVSAIGLTDGKLFLAGDFEFSSQRDQARALFGWQQIEELGMVSRQKVREMYSKSMAGLVIIHPLTRYKLALPVKMFEYMAAGIPVICSDFPLWRGIIEENRCGICVDPLNHKEIAAAIQYIFDHPEEARWMGENGCKDVMEKYNWETERQKLMTLYESLIEHH
jgi:hypothetical protein